MYSLRRYDWGLHLVSIALCCYFLSQAVTTYIAGVLESSSVVSDEKPLRPIEPTKMAEEEIPLLDDYSVVVERNVFNSAESGAKETPEEVGEQQLGELGPAVKTSLEIKILGTLMIGEGTDRRSSVTVAGGKGSKGAGVYYPGEEETFAPNVKLTKVDKDRIEFINSGRLEYAELEDFAAKKTVFASSEEVFGKEKKEGKGPAKGEKEVTGATDGNKIVVDQGEVDDALQNLDKLYSEVRIVPNFKEGRAAGMKVLSVKPGSIVGKLGIKRGDILDKVNGQELDIKQGMELFNQMRDLKNLSVELTRGGKNQTLEYEIK